MKQFVKNTCYAILVFWFEFLSQNVLSEYQVLRLINFTIHIKVRYNYRFRRSVIIFKEIIYNMFFVVYLLNMND